VSRAVKLSSVVLVVLVIVIPLGRIRLKDDTLTDSAWGTLIGAVAGLALSIVMGTRPVKIAEGFLVRTFGLNPETVASVRVFFLKNK
jgi:hypothetical protein